MDREEDDEDRPWEDEYFSMNFGEIGWDPDKQAYVASGADYDGEVMIWDTEEQAYIAVTMESGKLTWGKCLKGPDKDEWKQKAQDEVNNFLRHKAIRKVRREDIEALRQDGHKVEVISSFALPQFKNDPVTGTTEKKVRIVADGSHQKYFDIPNTYAPTPSASSVRLVSALAAQTKQPLYQADISRAFLHSEKTNDKVIHVLRPPPGVEEEGVFWIATRMLYGLKEAPRAFHNTLKPILQRYGLQQCPGEQCLWSGWDGEKPVYMVVQVDDFLVCSSREWFKAWIAYMRTSGIEIKDMGLASRFISIEVEQSADLGTVFLHQAPYAKAIVDGCKLDHIGEKATPLNIPKLTPEASMECTKEQHAEYRRVLGEVMYLQTMTRPDLAQACSFLSQFLECPLQWHYMELQRLVRYIRGTLGRGLVYGGPHRPPAGLKLGELVCFVDSSWASKRSVTGYILFFGGGAILWGSRKQKMTTASSAEAEIVAASEATKAVLALRLILRDIGLAIDGPTTLFEDNQAAIYFANNEATPPRLKHIDLRDNFVRDYVQSGEIRLVKIVSEDNCADLFTKPLPKDAFAKHRDLMVTKLPNHLRVFPGEVKDPEVGALG